MISNIGALFSPEYPDLQFKAAHLLTISRDQIYNQASKLLD